MKAVINHITMGYEESGAGSPVLLIHGFPLNRRMWQPQFAALAAAGHRVITPDLRGFGESDAPDTPYSMELFADDLIALLDHLGIDRAVVGGMSMGGYVLLNLLERYPERVSAACFLVTRSGADDEAGKARRLALAQEVLQAGPVVVADIFRQLLFAEETVRSNPALTDEIYRMMLATPASGLAGALQAMAQRKDYTPRLPAFGQPALIIGADQDQAVPPEHIRTLQAGLPRNSTHVIPGAGHLVNLEQPEAFNRCLLEFLRSLPS